MSLHSNHPYHLVDYKPWPLTCAFGAKITTHGFFMWFHQYNNTLMILGNIITMLTMYQLMRYVTHEGTYQSLHTLSVSKVFF